MSATELSEFAKDFTRKCELAVNSPSELLYEEDLAVALFGVRAVYEGYRNPATSSNVENLANDITTLGEDIGARINNEAGQKIWRPGMRAPASAGNMDFIVRGQAMTELNKHGPQINRAGLLRRVHSTTTSKDGIFVESSMDPVAAKVSRFRETKTQGGYMTALYYADIPATDTIVHNARALVQRAHPDNNPTFYENLRATFLASFGELPQN